MTRDYSSWITTDRIVWFDEGGREIGNAPAEALSRYRLAMAFKTTGKEQNALDTLNAGTVPDEGTFLQEGETRDLPGAWEDLLSELQ